MKLPNTCIITQCYLKHLLLQSNASHLFKVVDRIMNKRQHTLPSGLSNSDLAERFSDFFISKLTKIRQALDNSNCNHEFSASASHSLQSSKPAGFHTFSSVTYGDVDRVIKNLANKSCELDPWPTWLLRQNLDIVVCNITNIVNLSILQGTFPTCLKHALVRPLLKKKGLQSDNLANYRPVSNLAFLGKVIEKVIVSQLLIYMRNNNLQDELQSAYKKGHSCETALLKVMNDIQISLDLGNSVFLVLLDLSAAFDLVDFDILLSRLETELGVTGPALEWFDSYLRSRTQSVVIGASHSKPVVLESGVPYGSVLGPLLFLVYLLPLKRLFNKHKISYHTYADDLQLYVEFCPKDTESTRCALARLEHCISDVRCWMNQNRLKFNEKKTEFIVLSSPALKKQYKLENVSIHVGDVTIGIKSSVRDLGSVIDNCVSMEKHVSSITRSVYEQLQNIGKLRRYLDTQSCARIINCLVTSRPDFSNSLLFGLPKRTLHRLQLAQNHAARLLTGTKKWEHITPALYSLHWLPVESRIRYKIAVLTFKCLTSDDPPSYLRELLQYYVPLRALRSSSDKTVLVKPKARTKYGRRAFSYSAPHIWNTLPPTLRACVSFTSFKKQLKTYLFQEYYNV